MSEKTVIDYYLAWKEKVDKEISKLDEKRKPLKIERNNLYWEVKVYEEDAELKVYFKDVVDKNKKRIDEISDDLAKLENEISIRSRLSNIIESNIGK